MLACQLKKRLAVFAPQIGGVDAGDGTSEVKPNAEEETQGPEDVVLVALVGNVVGEEEAQGIA